MVDTYEDRPLRREKAISTLHVCVLSACLICPSIMQSVCLTILSICLLVRIVCRLWFVCLPLCPSVSLAVCLSTSINKMDKEPTLSLTLRGMSIYNQTHNIDINGFYTYNNSPAVMFLLQNPKLIMTLRAVFHNTTLLPMHRFLPVGHAQ